MTSNVFIPVSPAVIELTGARSQTSIGGFANLDRAACVFLKIRSAERLAGLNRSIGGKRDTVETRHHGVGIDHAPVHSRRASTTEQHLFMRQPLARRRKDSPDVMRTRRDEFPFFAEERHEHDEHERFDVMPRTNLERRLLSEDAAVMQSDHDMRHDFHARAAERGECAFKIRDRAIEVIHLTDRVGRTDHVGGEIRIDREQEADLQR
ncbi:MAG: hypothetical protein J0H36_12945, partial [Hyphomicrobium denitrificans]|nr:hypothetical protein [Hyphomicrobium denitrificans]